jgi:4-amino-4-deoxy-L-arabinose transferase-like glycosyltransferase
VVDQTLRFDPGKSPLYHIGLHWFCAVFGCRETALRGFSAIFALANAGLMYALADQLLGETTAIPATVIWAWNPLTVTLARWARMYSLLLTFSLGHLLLLFRLRRDRSPAAIAGCALLGAAMLYTHLSGALIIAAEIAMLTRWTYRGESTAPQWIAIAGALAVFAPYVPIAGAQSHALLAGHWLDWIGPSRSGPKIIGIVVSLISAAIGLWLVFGPPAISASQRRASSDSGRSGIKEPIRSCSIWLFFPLAALVAASLLLHPLIEVRYLAVIIPAAAMLIGCVLAGLDQRARNLTCAAIGVAFVALFLIYRNGSQQPWRNFARKITATNSPREPVFFESGFFLSSAADGSDLTGGFPQGFFRVPFDYYFAGSNPQRAINPFSLKEARTEISRDATAAGGAWLISGRPADAARAEMPEDNSFRVDLELDGGSARLYHIVKVGGGASP